MVTLAVDLSTEQGSVAVGSNKEVLACCGWSASRRHAEFVFHAIDFCLELSGCSRKDITTVFVASGPGSFTGVRLCVTVGKAFSSAGVQAFSISTLKAMHFALSCPGVSVVPVISVGENRLFAFAGGKTLSLEESKLLEVLKGVKNPLIIYKGELPAKLIESFRCVKCNFPLAPVMLSVPRQEYEPLRFHYLREPGINLAKST